MRILLALLAVLAALACPVHAAETVRLKATADIWLSDSNEQERNSSSGKHPRLKLKSIQEMAAVRFDASPAKGREVLKAALCLRRAGSDMLRYVRVSTVNQDWVEGSGTGAYGPADGATYRLADAGARRAWAWPGSEFCDVIMTSGNTLAAWAERKELPDGWIAVPLTPELVYALVAGDTDGLAVMDGGNLAFHNNFIHSVQSDGSGPYVEVELGRPLADAPARPLVKAEPAPDRAHLGAGALRLTIAEAKNVFSWRVSLGGRPVERWRVRHPAPAGATVFTLEDLAPGQVWDLEVVAVSPGGAASPPATLRATASAALAEGPALEPPRKPAGAGAAPTREGKMRVWACPGLVKISPEKPEPMFDDSEGRQVNAVWDGKTIGLFGARGEYVSYQLCIEKLGAEALAGVKVAPQGLKGPDGAAIGAGEIELFKNWYARNGGNQWQPAYGVPMEHGAAFDIPDPGRSLPAQQNQTIYVDLYIPKDARPGAYRGTVTVEASGVEAAVIPVQLEVFDFALPDRLSFWAELNGYRIPADAHDYWRLAHQHRCVANIWRFTPGVQGAGKDIRVDWVQYDKDVGPLLTGEAFKNCRRAGVPPEVMYLPFEDSWPTPLSKQTYNYQGRWPGRGEDKKWITEHYMTAPCIGDALSQDYKDAFLAVERQFIDHFRQKGYARTEMQCFFGGKNTHRIQYGSNMWWTTDEPYHWDDWLALQFFCRLFTAGRGAADPRLWAARADISRPNWQGRVMEGVLDCVYIGGFTSPNSPRRCRLLARDTGVNLRAYGSANKDTESNTRSVVWLLNDWMGGANASLPWQTLGDDGALDSNDQGAGGGNALMVPGKRFGLAVVGDLRLKALRDGQQLVEYLVELGKRRNLDREQIRAMVLRAVHFEAGRRTPGAGADNADALRFSTLKDRQVAGLRRAVADLIVKSPPAPPSASAP